VKRVRKALALVAIAAISRNAMADTLLRRAGPRPADASAAQAAQQAAQTQGSLRHALDAIRSFQAAQDAARAAARAGQSSVPNGLGAGALDPATPDPATGVVWINAGAPAQTIDGGRTAVRITQTGERALLTWNTFNVGRETDLWFDQSAGGASASSWVALNRVLPNMLPSQILGSVHAQGQVYVLNQNGILFGGASQLNVGALLAAGMDLSGSTLVARNQLFQTSALHGLTFSGPAGAVIVEAGAKLAADPGGRIVLLGGEVHNGGTLEAVDGQVFLAGGTGIALAPSPQLTAVRGLAPPSTRYAVVAGDGEVENTGVVSTPRGNITMVGARTLQNGLLTATTGAEANGSINLGADGLTTAFGDGSVTQILPDEGGKKVIGIGETFRPSSIQVRGDRIDVLDGATLYAPAGEIDLTAVMTAPRPSGITDPSVLDDTRIYVGAGARIDVSGLEDVLVAMEQNTIRAELRANELRDNPLLRSGPLRGRTVYFDARLGGKFLDGSGVADLSGYYDLLERDVAQLMIAGGKVSLAANQIVTRQGSVIDLSGGNLRTLDGFTRRTVLVDASGNRVPIEGAAPGVAYVGTDDVVMVAHPRWGTTETYSSPLSRGRARFERGYVQGGSAGTLSLDTGTTYWFDEAKVSAGAELLPANPSATGAFRILDGDVAARVTVGPKQREAPTGTADPTQAWRERPAAAKLVIGGAGDVSFTTGGPILPAGFGPDGAIDPVHRVQHALPASWFDGHGFGSVTINAGYDSGDNPPGAYSDTNRAPGGHLTVGEGVVVDVGDFGSFTFSGKSAEVEGMLLAPGGAVSLQALQKELDPAQSPTVHLGATGVIDVAGRWTNDALDGFAGPMRPLGGGTVSLTGARVLLDAGSYVDVSGGARLDATGTKITSGNAGSIAIDASRYPLPAGDTASRTQPFVGDLALDGALEGHALGKGGALTIKTGRDVVIGNVLDPASGLFDAAFFTRGGFASYGIVGGSSVTVKAGTVIAPTTETLLVPVSPGELPTGTRLTAVTPFRVLPEELRNPMTLSLSASRDYPAYPSTLTVQGGAAIRLDPGSTLTLGARALIQVDGTLETPGGTIALGTPVAGAVASRIELGEGARLLAPGWQKTSRVGSQTVRSVEAGGSVSLSSSNVTIPSGAVIDVSGIHGVADLASGAEGIGAARTEERAIDGAAGSISIAAAGGVVAGQLRLSAGGEAGAGGSLFISSNASGPVLITQHAPAPAASQPFTVVADRIDASGADDLTIAAALPVAVSFDNGNAILFDGDVDLHTGRSLRLVSPILARPLGGAPGSVTLRSAYVALEGLPSGPVMPDAANPGGELTVKADVIDVARTVMTSSVAGLPALYAASPFAKVTLDAQADIRLSDHDLDGNWAKRAGLLSAGAIVLRAAQVYVTSRSEPEATNLERKDDDPGFLVLSGERIDVVGNGNPAPVPLSFGERLTLRAPIVEQGGVLRAPAGEIRLEGRDLTGAATGSVTLLPGSVTSTSLQGVVVPFGTVLAGGEFHGYGAAGQAPARTVKLDAPAVAVKEGSIVDVSGGGDLAGFAFAPGDGGSSDALVWRTDPNGKVVRDSKGNPLAARSVALGSDLSAPFAILPSAGTQVAPVARSADLRDSRLHVGDQVWLQGVPGLPDGYYTLLPAHYALLPGGRLIEALPGAYAAAPASFVRADGAVIATGRLSHVVHDDAGNDRRVDDQQFGRFVVESKDVFSQYGQLLEYSFDASAGALAAEAGVPVRTPLDAGTVVLKATDSLTLQGIGRFGAGEGGLLGNLEVSASAIAVVDGGAVAPGPGYLTLDAEALMGFGAGSVLLGGTRARSTDVSQPGTVLTTDARELAVDLRGGTWAGPEIILAARESVTVADGSVLRAEGAASTDASALLLKGDGALLRLSTGGRVALVRTGVPGTPAAVLDVQGATLDAGTGSLALEASGTVALATDVALAARQIDLGSNDVHLGAAPTGGTGTWLGKDLITRLASSSDLLIRGHDAIHLHGDLDLGSRVGGEATMPALVLDTGLIQGEEGGAAGITAGQLTLRNSSSGSAPAGVAGTGTLDLDVDDLVIGPGQTRIAGFAALEGRAGTIEMLDRGSLDFAGGSLRLQTAQVRTTSGASATISAQGSLELAHGDGALTPPTSLGGSLSLRASTISLDTSIALPGGTVEATATGGPLTLGDHAVIDVSGVALDFHGRERLAPGGTIRLSAPSGSVAIAAGAVLDVSATAGGDAGTVALVAGGEATVLGRLAGTADEGHRAGAFSLVAAGVPSFSALNALVEQGGFTSSREVRLRQDIALAPGELITAREVELRSDTGTVRVAGRIDAAGKSEGDGDGGRIRLDGAGGVVVEGELDAHAWDGSLPAGTYAPSSSKVELVAGAGRVDVAAGARIDVSGPAGGSLVVRAPQQGDDVAAGIVGQVVGAREVRIQGTTEYAATVVDAALVQQLLADGAAWLRNGGAIAGRLAAANPGLAGLLQIGAGAVVTSGGDLSIASDVSLGGALGAGYLGFVAAGRIAVAGNVSDGFDDALVPAGHGLREASLSTGASSSLSFEAGGSIGVGAPGLGVLIRTGPGDVSLLAGGDIVLADPASAIYTAGRRTDRAAGFGGPGGIDLPRQPDGSLATMGEFPTGGGDVTLSAGGNIEAPVAAQTTSAWLFRYGASTWDALAQGWNVTQQTSWSVLFKNFEQGVGALGGGDVRVTAGGDVRELQVAIPTTGQLTTAPGQFARADDLVVRGGGDLDLIAGRDLVGGLFVLGRGQATLRAGGKVAESDRLEDRRELRTTFGTSAVRTRRQVGLLLGLADATASVTAGQGVTVEAVFDPMRQALIAENLVGGVTGSAFWGYTDRTALDVTALGGPVAYENDPWASVDLSLAGKAQYQVKLSQSILNPLNDLFSAAPPTLRLASLSGSVSVEDRFTSASTLKLAPAATGTLELMAAENVRLVRSIVLDDVDPLYARGPLAPFATTTTPATGAVAAELPNIDTIVQRGPTPIHLGDPDPVRITALEGSVCAQKGGLCTPAGAPLTVTDLARVTAPKPIEVYAGKDVLAGRWQPQHNAPSDVSVLSAGRDVYQPVLEVTGTGAAVLEAGRDVVLGERDVAGPMHIAPPKEGGAIYGRGNRDSAGVLVPALPAGRGADLYVLAGAAEGRVDWDGFAATYLDAANPRGVVRTYLPELRAYMAGLDAARYGALGDTELVAAFRELAAPGRKIFLEQVLFSELKETGLDHNDPESPRYKSYDRGFLAVKLLFPVDPATLGPEERGSVIFHGKQVETEIQGSITVLAPYGRVEGGTSAVQEFVNPALGGVVTRRGGDIRIMADENIDLFTSRVFTLQGGDITMWTSNGSITAGSGSKTSVFQKPLVYTMTDAAVVAVDAFGLQTGAGIGVLDAIQDAGDRPPSRLDLIAPRGEVNAGDAGIRVVGNLNIAAAVVVGMENIQATGASAGVPKIEMPSVGALTTASQITQAAASEGAGPPPQARNAVAELPSIITVEVVGYETADAPGQREEEQRRRERSKGR